MPFQPRLQGDELPAVPRLAAAIVDSDAPMCFLPMCFLELDDPTDPATLRIAYANAAAGAAWQTPLADVIGQPLLHAFPGFAHTDLPRCFCALLVEQRSATIDGFRYLGDERTPPGLFSLEAFPVGSWRLAVVFARMKAGAPSPWHLRQLAAIVDSSADAITSTTLCGTITSWNRAAETTYGYSRWDVAGRSISLIVPDDRREESERLLAAIRRGGQVDELDTVRVRKDGTRIGVRLRVSPVYDDTRAIVGASTTGRLLDACPTL